MKSFLAKLIAVSMLCGAMAFAQGAPAAGGGKKTDDTKKTDDDKGKGKAKKGATGKVKKSMTPPAKGDAKGKGKGKGKGKTKGGDDKGGATKSDDKGGKK